MRCCRTLLAEQLPDWRPCNADLPTGGLAVWMRLPAPMSSALSAAASRLGVDIPPGPRFGVDGTLERYIRVPYSLPDDQLTEGGDTPGPRVGADHRRHRDGGHPRPGRPVV